MFHRRRFLAMGLAAGTTLPAGLFSEAAGASLQTLSADDLESWLLSRRGKWDDVLYRQLLGAANEPKEGDAIVGVAAGDDAARQQARQLLSNTPLHIIDAHPPHVDQLWKYIQSAVDTEQQQTLQSWTLGQLKQHLLTDAESDVKSIIRGLSSDVIACVVRLMSNEELIQLGARLFHPLPGSQIGARGYLGARIQPNSPTDNADDIRWQVLDAFAYAVGDVLLGTNPVSSEPESVLAVERTLKDVLDTFGLAETMPHCVLAHIDVQAEVERRYPGSTALWFQSIAGNDAANATFDISIDSMRRHAASRQGKFGLYFETGQGADFTNGHGFGVDMVIFEARKYGFARALTSVVADTLQQAGTTQRPWVHLNDVAGFIGPEVFRTREQLVRCCLEDIAMGKLHGLTIGLDICSTLHMDVSLDDLGWCIDQVMPANPAYLMALPTRIDPMLGYLTTGYQDHVHIREKFGYRVNDRMWAFFRELGIIDESNRPARHFGDPAWVYLQYLRRRGDQRSEAEIRAEADQKMSEVRGRGVFLAEGYGASPSQLAPQLQSQIQTIYKAAKISIWKELDADFVARVPAAIPLQSRSANRTDYILHPTSGERLSDASTGRIGQLRQTHQEQYNVQIVVSDGLNAIAVMKDQQLWTLLAGLRSGLADSGFRVAPETLVVFSGRVRAGYRVGEDLFGGRNERCAILHVIGERPGTGHDTLSVYMTIAAGDLWGQANSVDHNITRVVSGIATTALIPELAAADVVRIFAEMSNK